MSEHLVARLGHLGDGLATDGTVLPGALPGEKVELVDDRVRILSPSDKRVRPPCRHAASCGGCTLQHAAPPVMADWKRELVVSALRQHDIDAEVAKTITSPPRSRRRASFTAIRTKKSVTFGFRRKRSRQIVDIVECEVLRPEILAAFPALRELGALASSRKSEVRLSVTTSETGLDVVVLGGKELDLNLRQSAAAWAETADVARLSWGGETIAGRRPPFQNFGAARVAPPPGAFLQATEAGEAALVQLVRSATVGARRVVDLFAGCGTFSLPLAENAEVRAVEGDPAFLAALDAGWRTAEGLRRVTTEARDLFRRPLLAEELKNTDAVVFDPPRAGAQAQTAELALSQVPTIVGVSCNPATFARDAATLIAAGWSMERATPVDQFLWSPHVELVGVFQRN
ncbi:MAG: class I SAM-dependent RNA methyltransferase [Pseudomonadota bacterium]